MRIDLHDLIVNPGKSLSFSRELDTAHLDHPSVAGYAAAPVGEGIIRNEGGALSLRGRITADMRCICDRCASEYALHKEVPMDLALAVELEDEENPDFYLLENGELDIDEVLEDCFILDMDSRFLCREDCKGLCDRCGANLNDGPCSCARELDPRLAVLEQLLDNKE